MTCSKSQQEQVTTNRDLGKETDQLSIMEKMRIEKEPIMRVQCE